MTMMCSLLLSVLIKPCIILHVWSLIRPTVEVAVWNQVIKLYPALVECTTSPSPQVRVAAEWSCYCV